MRVGLGLNLLLLPCTLRDSLALLGFPMCSSPCESLHLTLLLHLWANAHLPVLGALAALLALAG